jgi:prepilin-type N-terminal cleavage/methylation domain-containing protein
VSLARSVWARLRGERGYSLVELLATMSILGIVLGSLMTIFVSGSKAELDMNRRFQAQQDVRVAFSKLRTDIHTACNAAILSGGTELDLYNYDAVAATCSPTVNVTWCVTPTSPTMAATRRALYRVAPATDCSSPTTGKLYADKLLPTSVAPPTVFTANAPGTGQRPSVGVDLRSGSNPTSTSKDVYELLDTIVLRNGAKGT